MNKSRKYRMAILYLVLATVVIFSKSDSVADWLQYTSLVVMAYMGGNAVEHMSKRKK